MREITLEELLEAGCHFGHQIIRSNPKARDFVYEAREGIQIIDLAKTKEGLEEAARFFKSVAANGGVAIVVGTKRQAQETVKEEVKRAKELLKKDGSDQSDSIFYVAERWVGGILTNFSEISRNLQKLEDLTEKLENKREQEGFTKKEIGLWDKEKQRLESFYGGLKGIKKVPDALFIIDSHMEDLAVKEAIRMNIKTVAIVDTNANPEVVNYPIPANDDAVGSVKLIASYIIDAWVEGKKAQSLEIKSQKEAEVKKEKGRLAFEQAEVKKEIKTKKEAEKKPKAKKDGEDEKSKSGRSKKTA